MCGYTALVRCVLALRWGTTPLKESRITHSRPWPSVAYPGILFRGRCQQIQLRAEDRENGDLGGGSHLVRGSGGICNLVQEISFHIVKFS